MLLRAIVTIQMSEEYVLQILKITPVHEPYQQIPPLLEQHSPKLGTDLPGRRQAIATPTFDLPADIAVRVDIIPKIVEQPVLLILVPVQSPMVNEVNPGLVLGELVRSHHVTLTM